MAMPTLPEPPPTVQLEFFRQPSWRCDAHGDHALVLHVQGNAYCALCAIDKLGLPPLPKVGDED